MGNRHHDRRLAKGDDDSAGSCVCQRQREGLEGDRKKRSCRDITYFDYAKERKSLSKGESSYTPATFSLVVSLHAALKLHQGAWPQKSYRQCVAFGCGDTPRPPPHWTSRTLR